MADKSYKRCLICGRLFEISNPAETTLETGSFEESLDKGRSFCNLCEAKIKKEAKDTQREPKPM